MIATISFTENEWDWLSLSDARYAQLKDKIPQVASLLKEEKQGQYYLVPSCEDVSISEFEIFELAKIVGISLYMDEAGRYGNISIST